VLRPECGGDDCNDADAQIRPGVGETCDDGIDNDCDGAIDAKDIDCGGDDGSEGGEEGGDGDDGPPRLWQPGCGCRAAPAPASWYGLVMLGLLGVLGWRRRESSVCSAAE
jgi:MYXO-CTERM domain-containing protein